MAGGRLEITTKIGCSINCVYCPQAMLLKNYFKDDKQRKSLLSLEDFKICIDKIPLNTRIDFSGMAEPWLNSACTDMVLYAHEKGHPIAIYTTLVGMSREDFERIRDIEFEEFVLHIPDDKSNAHIQITDAYIDLLHEVIEYKINGNSLVTGYSCHGDIHPDILDAIPSNSKLITELIDRAGNVESDYVESKENVGKIVCINCGQEMNHNVLLPDGTVLLCCMDYGMKHVLGNLLEKNYDDLQKSSEARRVKAGMEDQTEDVLCRKCTNGRNVEDLYKDLTLYRDWCGNLLKNEKEKDLDLINYKQWVTNLQEREASLKNQLEHMQQQYDDRVKELKDYTSWVENLQGQLTAERENYEDQIRHYKEKYEDQIRHYKEKDVDWKNTVDKICNENRILKLNDQNITMELKRIQSWRGYRLLARLNADKNGSEE